MADNAEITADDTEICGICVIGGLNNNARPTKGRERNPAVPPLLAARRAAHSLRPRAAWLPMGSPDNAGVAAWATSTRPSTSALAASAQDARACEGTCRFTQAAREGTSAGFHRGRVPAYARPSLTAAAGLLSSVVAVGLIVPENGGLSRVCVALLCQLLPFWQRCLTRKTSAG